MGYRTASNRSMTTKDSNHCCPGRRRKVVTGEVFPGEAGVATMVSGSSLPFTKMLSKIGPGPKEPVSQGCGARPSAAGHLLETCFGQEGIKPTLHCSGRGQPTVGGRASPPAGDGPLAV